MYHLFVTAQAGTWDGSPHTFDISRVIREYTDADTKRRYETLDEAVIAELRSFPALFAYEEAEETEAKVGFINCVEQHSNKVRVKYGIFAGLSPMPPQLFSELSWELKIGEWEMNRTHWAIKNVDLLQVLLKASLITKEQLLYVKEQLSEASQPLASNASPRIDQIKQIPTEDRRNSGLILLMLLAQAYYKMLECATSMSRWRPTLDMELNQSYFWIIESISNLLKNHDDLKDFPAHFDPILPDLYPSTIRDMEWQDMIAPEVEQFLCTVQKYVTSKDAYDPQEGTLAWIFIQSFRPAIDIAIERATAYQQRMAQHAHANFGQFPEGLHSPQEHACNISSEGTGPNATAIAASPQQEKVFISYSHKDKKFLDELLAHLKPLERAGCVSTWSDVEIRPGSQWLEEIERTLASTKVAVLLVTKDFLASEFICQNELAPLLKTAHEDGVTILWVLLRDCNWKKTALKDYQAAYPTDQPLAEKHSKRDKAWVAVCEAIVAAIS